MEPLQPRLGIYPSEIREKLANAQRRLELQNAYVAQTEVLIDLTQRLNALTA